MLTLLTTKAGIDRAQDELCRKLFKRATTVKRDHMLGFSGGHQSARVAWFEDLDFWFGYRRMPDYDRHWNVFGLGNPFERNVSIIFEATLPFSGVNRRFAGGFAEDEDNRLYLIHRGKIGGGREGVGKTGFLQLWPPDPLFEIMEGDREGVTAVVGVLDSDALAAQVHYFATRVDEIKRQLVGKDATPKSGLARPTPSLGDDAYKDEFAGKKKYTVNQQIEAEATHGIVVKELHSILDGMGLSSFRDGSRDLYIGKKKQGPTTLFEVKAQANTTSLYTAVGQLMFHAKDGTRRVAVLPSTLKVGHAKRLKELGVRVVTFTWDGNRPSFTGLDEALS